MYILSPLIFHPGQSISTAKIVWESHKQKIGAGTVIILFPGQYFIQMKIEKAKDLLDNQNLSIKEIAYDLKFDSCFYFSKLLKQKTGMSPTIYRKRTLY